ncbi:hypothetical protein FRC10_008460 [Ceratobasidium sp. 414]|nr:hypothetical protein FRC10_008460 [Ceratobasidium sp. 414]
MLILNAPLDFKTCLDSAECVIGVILSAATPALVVIFAALYVIGLRLPKLSIFTEFIAQEDVSQVLIRKDAAPESSEAGMPSEQTPLLSLHTPSTVRPEFWRQTILTLLGLLESIGWTYALVFYARNAHSIGTFIVLITSLSLVSWVYSTLRPGLRPSCTPYYDLFTIYGAHFLAAGFRIYETAGMGHGFSLARLIFVLDATLSLLGLVVILSMPLNGLGKFYDDEDGNAPSLEDQCTLWQWISFTWVNPLISIGVERPLDEKDVWQLSQTMQTRVLMRKFFELKQSSLLHRLFVANAKDLFLDFVLTVISTLMNFSAPFFLALILRAMTDSAGPTPAATSQLLNTATPFYSTLFFTPATHLPVSVYANESQRPMQRSDAYLFAVAAFICQLVKSQSELQHLYFARRAAVRIRGELVASVYEKALRHKDITGSVQSSDIKVDRGKGEGKGKGGKGGAPQDPASADYVYDTPLSIVIAGMMLYRLMGWTAFTGYAAVVIALPLNTLLVRRTSSLLRGISTIRDRRMRAMNEVILAIKFIKYSAWESRWISRILQAREDELKWLKMLKLTAFSMNLVWEVVPVLVSAIGFAFYTLVAGKELTVDVAFPCITVFAMLGQSLGQLPKIANWFLISSVSLKRIESYLSEDEVPEYVSSLKRSPLPPHAPVDGRLGCTDATFRWTRSSAAKLDKSPSNQKLGFTGRLKKSWDAALVFMRLREVKEVEAEEVEQAGEEKPFELRNGVILKFDNGTVLSALLGEMDRVEGEVYLPKEPTRLNERTGLQTAISYCAQQPWLQHKSIKDNILFGLPFDEDRYKFTLSCCALLPDLAIFEDGDETEIGEKGISLSGGQKARVALARAVYARTQVVILDDILSGISLILTTLTSLPYRPNVLPSAVDAPTAEHLVQKCLLGPLMKHRTVVLVTHHVDLVLPSVSWVVKLHEGQIEVQGTTAELRESGALASAGASQKKVQNSKQEHPGDMNDPKPKDAKDVRKLVEDETKSTGNVKIRVYKTYLSAASYWLFSLLIVFLAVDQLMQLVQKFWIKRWGESYETRSNILPRGQTFPRLDLPSASHNVIPYLLIYVGIQGGIIVVRVLNQIPRITSTLRASRILFEKMLRSVVRAPSRFFDTTPSGRILNRFSKDIDDIDSGLQNYIVNVVAQVIALVVAVGTIVYAVPAFIVPAVAIAYIHLWFARGYVVAARDLTRIQANTRSPIISSFGEIVVGITTVRAFGAERYFLSDMYKRLDRTLAAVHYYWMCNRWLLVRFDSLGALSVLVATTGSLAVGANAGLIGIVVVQAQQYVRSEMTPTKWLALQLYWGLRYWTELEQSLNSVERVQEYLELPSEPPAIIGSNRPPAAWPSTTTGTLIVENLVIHYAPPVLRGVTFGIKPSEKIGVVGRTGSGKSTLALALFRFVDPTAGSITLDGIGAHPDSNLSHAWLIAVSGFTDITSIGLDDLRSRLTLIPQDAVLFNGTIRDNLDPFNEFSDAELINILQRVHLVVLDSPEHSPVVTPPTSSSSQQGLYNNGPTLAITETAVAANAPVAAGSGKPEFTLETKVSDGGNNFSHGQRQLLSLARALLRKSNVIVMDESTASVDFQIDAKIQRTIREEFDHAILITIAHRLRTVIDYDRILVLDAGCVVEYDAPQKLLAKGDGAFHAMCKKSGDYEELITSAALRIETPHKTGS